MEEGWAAGEREKANEYRRRNHKYRGITRRKKNNKTREGTHRPSRHFISVHGNKEQVFELADRFPFPTDGITTVHQINRYFSNDFGRDAFPEEWTGDLHYPDFLGNLQCHSRPTAELRFERHELITVGRVHAVFVRE